MKTRCSWVPTDKPLYIDYHDNEWGEPVNDDLKHFEMITLEGAQAGLSWYTILKRREEYRRVFLNFDPVRVAKMNDKTLEDILLNSNVVRNRLKVFSVRKNAIAFLDIQKELGSFDTYVWRFMGGKPKINIPIGMKDMLTHSLESDLLSKDLKKRGMSFVGTTIIYAYMQAIGMINDHMKNCYKSKEK